MKKVDWTKAPEGAEFYAGGLFWSLSGCNILANFGDGWWLYADSNHALENLTKSPDYQQRPEESKARHCTGQMTAGQLNNTKIAIEAGNNTLSFIAMCKEIGIKLTTDDISYLDGLCYLVCTDPLCEGLRLQCVTDHIEGFDGYKFKEITWQPEEPIEYNKESIKEPEEPKHPKDLPTLGFTINGYTLEAYNKDYTKAFLTNDKEVITLGIEDVKYKHDIEKYDGAVDYIVKNSKHHLKSVNLYSILKLYEQYKQQ